MMVLGGWVWWVGCMSSLLGALLVLVIALGFRCYAALDCLLSFGLWVGFCFSCRYWVGLVLFACLSG